MAGTAYQGTQIKMIVQGEDHYLNVDMDATFNFLSYQWKCHTQTLSRALFLRGHALLLQAY